MLKVNLCDSFDDEYILRFFNSHGETVNYRIKSKLYNKFNIDNAGLPILAEYKINGEYVYNINFDMDFQEYGSFPCLKNSNRFGNYFYNDNTLMFLYNGIKNDENSSNPEYYYKNKHSYNADIFKAEKNYQPQIIILYDNQNDVYIDDNNTIVYNIESSGRNNISVGSANDITDGDRIFIT